MVVSVKGQQCGRRGNAVTYFRLTSRVTEAFLGLKWSPGQVVTSPSVARIHFLGHRTRQWWFPILGFLESVSWPVSILVEVVKVGDVFVTVG